MYRTKFLKNTEPANGSVRVTWMGTAGLYVSDGETGLYIDPFVSRYGLFKVGLGFSLKPQIPLIDEWIGLTHGQNAAAILVSHSHYDHVMDVPRFAEKTGAMIVGSESTANVALGAGIPEKQLQTIIDRDTVRIGKFEITFIKSIHSPALFGKIPWPGNIEQPLTQPAPASNYREGGAYAIWVKHPKGTFLHYGSPGVKPGIFDGMTADVVFLSIGGRKDTGTLIDHVLTPLHPKTVIPIHFDDLFGPVDKKVKPLIGVKMGEFWTEMDGKPFEIRTLPVGESRVLFH
jgi:L-ascorbate metabolism protein UlaG (beta-lactamase superfamily)